MDSCREEARLYREQGFAQRVGFGDRPAVLVVDFQRIFTRGELSSGRQLELRAVQQTRLLLAGARARSVPVIYTFVAYRPDLADAGCLKLKAPGIARLTQGTEQVQIDELITPSAGDLVVEKKMPSAFFGTCVQLYLTTLAIDTLIVAGTCTSGCVRATVVDCCSHGYRTIVPRECVADRSEAVNDANLFDIDSRYADVLPLKEVLEYLEGQAGQ